jgi:hypothetical protein
MLYLQATQKARDFLGLDPGPYDPPGTTESALGNWMLNLVPIGQRTALLFMSVESLLSFPILIGQEHPTAEDVPDFMAHGLKQLMKAMNTPKPQSSRLLKDLGKIAVCRPVDKSLVGVFAGVAADYHQRTLAANDSTGHLIGSIIFSVNSAPKVTLGARTPFEVSSGLLARGAA